MNGIYGWLAEASREQKRTLLAASLGWMLDSMDVMLYALVLGEVQREMHLSAALSGAMMSATLVSAAVGGLGFGWFADRFGRVRALTFSVLVYSVATALCGFTHTASQLMALPGAPGTGHGRRVGLGRGAGCGDLACASSRQGSSARAKLVGDWLRAGRSGGRAGDAPLRLAGRLLCRRRAGSDHALVAAAHPRTRSMAARSNDRSPDWDTLPRHVRPRHAGLRHHERCHAVCMVGALHMGAALSFHACRRGRPRTQHRPDIGVDDRHAGRHVSGLCRVRLSLPTVSAGNTPISAIYSLPP